MRILLIGPGYAGGSIPPYLDVLAAALRRSGAHVGRVGSTGVPYDPVPAHSGLPTASPRAPTGCSARQISLPAT